MYFLIALKKSLSIIILRLTHIVLCINRPFLSVVSNILQYVCRALFVSHSFIDGHLSFQVL